MSVYIEKFEIIFGVKNNIKALRNKVLELAIQGKLVEQCPNDEPASELVKKIKIERDKLVEEGNIKKLRPLSEITVNEKSFQIPNNWEWVRLNEIFDVRDGTHNTPAYVSTGYRYPLVTSKNLDNGNLNFANIKYISKIDYDIINQRSCVENGDILFAMIGSIGNPVLVKKDTDFAIKNVALIKNLPKKHVDMFFSYFYLLKEQRTMKQNALGGVQSFVSLSYLRNYIIPLPPLNEQHRIVTKIESLMSEIDKLEESLQKKEHLMELLPKTIVDVISKCKTGEELKEQLQFLTENFEYVFQTPKSMQELRNVVLQLAIEGRLASQDINDEPASELVKKIKIEKGKIKKQQPFKPIDEADIPFEIPEAWEWVRLGDVGDSLIGLTYSPTDVVNDGLAVLRSNNIKNGKMNYDSLVYVNKEIKYSLIVQKNDILICARNGSKRLVGKSALIDEKSAGKMAFGAFMALFRSQINEYVYLMLNSIFFRSQLGESNTMTVNQVTQSMIRNILIPIPPQKEQHRIVERVESIMSLIDQMEAELKRKVDLVEKMANV